MRKKKTITLMSGLDERKIAKRLERLREKQHLTHEELSEAIMRKCLWSVSPSFLRKIERWGMIDKNGHKIDNNPSVVTFAALAKYYGVTVDYLLCMTNTKSPKTTIQAVNNALGLSDKSIKNLIEIKKDLSGHMEIVKDNEAINATLFALNTILSTNYYILSQIGSYFLTKPSRLQEQYEHTTLLNEVIMLESIKQTIQNIKKYCVDTQYFADVEDGEHGKH